MRCTKTAALLGLTFMLAACGGGEADTGSGEGAGAESAQSGGGEEAAVTSEAACAFAGTWVGPFAGGALAGTEITWEFHEDGSTRTAFNEQEFTSQWQIEGDLVSVTDDEGTPCTGVRGSFQVTWEEGCDQVRVASTEDTCETRRASIDGMTLRRQ